MMSEYKSGDIAALFAKPEKPTTESGKKLQSLFEEFHTKNKSKPANKKIQLEKNAKEFFISKHPDKMVQRAEKKACKKGTVSDADNSNSDQNVKNCNVKKRKLNSGKTTFQANESLVTSTTDSKEQNVSLNDKSFPRRKKRSVMKSFDEKSPQKNFDQSFLNYASDLKPNQNTNKKNSVSGVFQSDHNANEVSLVEKKESSFSKKSMHLSSDSKSDVSNKSIQVNYLRAGGAKKIKGFKQKKEQFYPNISNSSSEGQNFDTLENADGKKTSTEEDSEDYIRISNPSSQTKRIRNVENTIFVGNLPLNATKKDLRKLFSQFGEVKDIRIIGIIPENPKLPLQVTARKRNYHPSLKSLKGFIEFKEKQSLVDALALNGTFFKGNHIFVDQAASKKKLYDNKRSVFIGNLPFDIEEEAVWTAFIQFGSIDCIRIVRDRNTGVSKGFGYVVFTHSEAKEKALGFDKLQISGRDIRIKAIQSENSKTNERIKQFDTFKSKALKMKKKQGGSSSSKKSVKKIKKKLKMSQKKKHISSFLLNEKKGK